MKRFAGFGILIAFCMFTSLISEAYQKDKVYKLTILHTNDQHGHYWKNEFGEAGFSAAATLIKQIRGEVTKDGGHVLLLSGGDVNTGTPHSDQLDAEPDFKGMKLLGYDAMALGNHEFDKPLSVLKKQMQWAQFPFLGANIFSKKTGQHMFQTHTVKTIDDLRVAIVGFTTQDTNRASHIENAKLIDVRDPALVAQTLVPALDRENDLVIAVTHMGHYKNPTYRGSTDDIMLARSVDGIDIIVGGHTQIPLFEPDIVNNTYILQAHEWGKYVGRLDLEFVNGSFQIKSYKLIPVNLKTTSGRQKFKNRISNLLGCSTIEINSRCHLDEGDYEEKKIPEDISFFNFFKKYYQLVDKRGSKPIGFLHGQFLGRPGVSKLTSVTKESNLGRSVVSGMIDLTNADFGYINNGALRVDLAPGIVTFNNILSLMPFNNTIVTVELSGPEVKALLEKALNDKETYHYAGVRFVVHQGRDGKIKIEKITINNSPVDMANASKRFKFVTISFLARSLQTNAFYRDTGVNDAVNFKNYIMKKRILKSEDFQSESWTVR